MTAISEPISRTAQYMALFRALESAKPASRRAFNDPFATRFLPPALGLVAMLSRAPGGARAAEWLVDALWPGPRSSGVARTHLIDAWVRDSIAKGLRQVVILGAGFDCRALRLVEMKDLWVFEVDRNALLAWKAERLHGQSSSNEPRRVGVDFLKDDVAERLCAAGFEVGAPTLFVWEGVTNYLDDAAVTRVFDMVVRLSGPGGRVIYTYVHRDVIDGTFDAPGIARTFDILARSGEAWTFGFLPEDMPSYLDARGLTLRADLGASEYRRKLWGKSAEVITGYEFYRVALADINGVEGSSHAAG